MTNDDYNLDYLLYGGLPPGPLDSDNDNTDNVYFISCNNCIHSESEEFGLRCSIFNEYVSSDDAYNCDYYE